MRNAKITFVNLVKLREFSKHRKLMPHKFDQKPPFSASTTLDCKPINFGTSLAFDINRKAMEVATKLNKAMQVFIPGGGFAASPRPEPGKALLTQEQVQITLANRQNYFR